MIFIRTAGEPDFSGIAAILSTTRSHTFNMARPEEGLVADTTFSSEMRAILKQRLVEPNSEFIVADDGKGGVDAMAFATYDPDTEIVQLRQLFMRPDRQDPAVALALVDEIDGSFPGAKTLRVDLDENQRAVNFYVENGFALTGEVPFEGSDFKMRILERPILWIE